MWQRLRHTLAAFVYDPDLVCLDHQRAALAIVVIDEHAGVDFDDTPVESLEDLASNSRRVPDDDALGTDGAQNGINAIDLDNGIAGNVTAVPERSVETHELGPLELLNRLQARGNLLARRHPGKPGNGDLPLLDVTVSRQQYPRIRQHLRLCKVCLEFRFYLRIDALES